jgi:hypothetical protein
MGSLARDLRRHGKKLRKKFTERQRWDFDVYLLSYPKCGRTWVTLQMGRAISQHFGLEVPNLLKLSTFGEALPEVPHIRLTHDDQLAGKKVILLVRDPRDVIVSYYHHKSRREPLRDFWWFQRKRKETHSRFQGTLAEFLEQDIGGFDTLLRYYAIWEKARHAPGAFLLLRYEDMQTDPAGQLRRVLDFIGLSRITDAEVKEAVEYASFRNMQKIEAGEEVKSFKLKAGDVNDPNSYKVRRGKVGGYRDELTPEQIAKLERKMAARLSAFYGYAPNAG